MNEGFIKLFRKFTKWEWYSNVNTKTLFLHLLLTTNHEDKKWQGRVIKRGQVVIGLASLSAEIGLSIQQIRTAIKHLKSTGEITTETTNHFTIITLINWEKYQDYDTRATNKNSSNQQSSNNQVTTNNNDNNVNNKKNIYMLKFEEFWHQYPKKMAKAKARDIYLKLKPNEELHSKILMSLTFFKDSKEWKKDNGQFIPYPTTFLNQRRWEDYMK